MMIIIHRAYMNPNEQIQEEKETCFSILNNLEDSRACVNRKCMFNCSRHKKSCSVVALLNEETGRLTLQGVGDMFDLSRMRICQIEKSIIEKLKKETLYEVQETGDLE